MQITAPLPCIADLHTMMNMIKYLLLIAAPVGGGQYILRSVAGNAMNDHLRRHQLNTADEDIGVFIQCECLK